ncbi:hypothetical protein [Bradyrhizobium sp. WD16]|uniref:hypothetical protein n=1 Tax=Bradyrhizobium sp. WD16 TaxID=1521768 RepID=UPI0020A2EEEA|nr:hypothetical protein [Bradyrhizobium sp. WD16]UTD25978.1 hypothetical protein DB459_02610 [Bradyrhizobium sp. WD16]
MPSVVTIIVPLAADKAEPCSDYLRANAEPRPDFADGRLQCQPLFPFDEVTSLHFCSFVILPAEAGFGPRLVFEATIDGSRTDFLRALLGVAGEGLHDIFRHCEGYPAAGIAEPELVREFLETHDIGCHAFFTGAPGRSVAQIQDENRLHGGIVRYLRRQWQDRVGAPGRLPAIFDFIRRDFVANHRDNRWAMSPARLPWEMTARALVALAALIAAVALAYLFGRILSHLFPALEPWALYAALTATTEAAGDPGSKVIAAFAAVLPDNVFFEGGRPALPMLVGVTLLWGALRGGGLVLGGLSHHPRDQSFALRFLLHLAVIFSFVMTIFLAGSVLRLVIAGLEQERPATGVVAFAVAALALVVTVLILAALDHALVSLRLMVELKALSPGRERLRRAARDLVIYAMVLTAAIGLLIIARQSPLTLGHDVADRLRGWLGNGYEFMAYVMLGVVGAYALGLLLFAMIRALELRDRTAYADASGLIARAADNVPKYAREEGGINTYQNHFASLTYVKGGVARRVLLRVALFAVNLLARCWFNRGELGGIPTILSARWVMMDGGRRLLFLDNYSGACDSYLNEFIDLPGFKGLNAIWTNTFVHADGRRTSFPATQFLLWGGAQSEQPFKAYVRQSQIETLVWYSAYPTLATVNVNANTDLRQALSGTLAPCEVDAVFQRL